MVGFELAKAEGHREGNEFSGILIPHTRLFCARELESKQVGSGLRCGEIALQSDGASILRHRRCKALINNVI